MSIEDTLRGGSTQKAGFGLGSVVLLGGLMLGAWYLNKNKESGDLKINSQN